MRLSHLRPPVDGAPRSWKERGAAMVEFGLVAPVLILLVFGTLDMGYRWRFAQESVGASRAGARVGAGLGDDYTTDYYILTTIKTSLDSAGLLGNLDRVIVYKANADGEPTSGCMRTTGPAGECSIYPKAVVTSATLATTQFNTTTGCYTGGGALVTSWCAKTRNVDQRTADYLGVMVILDTPSITKMFPAGKAHRRSVMRMEPK